MASGALAQPNRAVPSGRFSSARFVAPGFRGLAGIVGLLVLVALWYLASYVATPSVVPLPHTVIACIVDWFYVAPMLAAVGLAESGFGPNLAYTVTNVVFAVVVGSAIGVVLGVGSARSPMFRAIVNPIVSGATAVPLLVMAPFFLVWFGVGRVSGVLLVTLYTSVILIIFSQRAVLNLDPVFQENAMTLGARPGRILRDILIPATVPEMLGGLRIALAGAWGLETVAELLGSSVGIGVMIRVLTGQADTIGIMAAVVAISTVAVLFDACLYLAARRGLRWKQR